MQTVWFCSLQTTQCITTQTILALTECLVGKVFRYDTSLLSPHPAQSLSYSRIDALKQNQCGFSFELQLTVIVLENYIIRNMVPYYSLAKTS